MVLDDSDEEVEERNLPMGLDGAADLDVVESVPTPDRQLAKSEDPGAVLTKPKKLASSTPKRVLKSVAQARRSRQRFRLQASIIAGFQRSEPLAGQDIEEGKGVWLQTRLVVCLKFSCQGTDKVQQILLREPVDGQVEVATPNSPVADVPSEVPATPLNDLTPTQILVLDVSDTVTTAPTTHASDTDTERSVRTLVPFERPWIDETRKVNIKEILGTLRAPDVGVPALSESFNWFPEAVPVDAIFPPGVPISAKEIMAFYPHHIRWKGVALRLANNAYLGDTIIAMQAFFRDKAKHPLSITNVNQFFRDVLKHEVSDFKVSNFQGKPDRNLYTDHLRPSKLLNGSRYGFVVPTFGQLLEGLVYLPVGLDARGLTQCLAWYLDLRDTFTPRLDLNVLHAQSLMRALQMPLRPYEPRDLDKLALQEWKENEQFAKRRADEQESSDADRVDHSPKQLTRSRVTINTDTETLGVDVVVKLRHILTFPYLAIGRMLCKAFELGIEKAESRKVAREAEEATEKADLTNHPAQENGVPALSSQEEAGSKGNSKDSQKLPAPGFPAGYKIPKKKRLLLEDGALETQSKKRMRLALAVPSVPLEPQAKSISRCHAIAPQPLTTSVAPREPINEPPSFSAPDPIVSPASMFGYRRSQNLYHNHSAPYSSTFSDQYDPPPYASRFSDYAPPSHYGSRVTSGSNTAYNTQHRYGDRGMSEFASRGRYGPPITSGWKSEHDSRNRFGDREEPQPRNAQYPCAQTEPYSRGSLNGGGHDGRR
ncbi:hypothetical protein PMIN06_003641 [Paraphaeosphaeria minitans]